MKNVYLLLMGIFFVSVSSAQTEVGDATLPNSQNFENHSLVLNGAGVREKLWIDLYAAGLYLDHKSKDAKAILEADEPMAIKLHIVSKLITSDKMVDAVTEGFEKSTNGNMAPIQKKIDTMLDFFKEDIHKNDIFDLVYIPNKGVTAYKNGKARGTVAGMDFKKALFGIWLSGNPADDDLKEDLLGK
ncbi:MAG TPA: chalcone isomerase family protein [Salinimicrobium sp.]|nr:chalcone isomerase family protein [Salinimicrobium sp.]